MPCTHLVRTGRRRLETRIPRGKVPLIPTPRIRLSAAILAGALALALAGQAAGSWMIPPSPDRPKDFTIVKQDGIYHLFYIRNNPNLPAESTQVDFGHAISKDLYFWTPEPPVLPTRPGQFDASHVWAPSIVRRDSVYYMFYTGVVDSSSTYQLYQRMGLATSTDLYTWNPLELPVYGCGQVPWCACDSTDSKPFRDPFVMEDPTTPGRWLMYYSTAPASDPGGMIIAVASSDGDFTQWQDLEPLWITQRQYTYNDAVESPHAFEHDGLWYLFFTTNSGQPISFATSNSPIAPLQDWIYRGRLSNMIGVNTAGWFASEYLRDGLVDYFLFVDGDRIEVSRMVWNPGWTFLLAQPDLFHVQSMTWTPPAHGARAGQHATLGINSTWWSGHTADLECLWISDQDGSWNPVPNSVLGIPDHIVLTADSTSYDWAIKAIPDSFNVPYPQTLVMRLTDQTATSNPIQIYESVGRGGGFDPPPPPPPPDTTQTQGGGSDDASLDDALPKLRPLSNSIFGDRPALLVQMPKAAAVRLDVFDLQGRRVRTLADRTLPQGATVLPWDGRDSNGRALARGVYFTRLRTGRVTLSSRVLLR